VHVPVDHQERHGHLDDAGQAAAVAAAPDADAVVAVLAGVALVAGVAARAPGTGVALVALGTAAVRGIPDLVEVGVLFGIRDPVVVDVPAAGAGQTGVALEDGRLEVLDGGLDDLGHVGLAHLAAQTVAQKPDEHEREHERSQVTHLDSLHSGWRKRC